MPFWKRTTHPDPEAQRAVERSAAQLAAARALHGEVVTVRDEAVRSLRQNNYGAAVTAVMMGGKS